MRFCYRGPLCSSISLSPRFFSSPCFLAYNSHVYALICCLPPNCWINQRFFSPPPLLSHSVFRLLFIAFFGRSGFRLFLIVFIYFPLISYHLACFFCYSLLSDASSFCSEVYKVVLDLVFSKLHSTSNIKT
jgi:hypothetical protein